MAKQKNNIVMRSTRGMVGGQIVFKRRAGKGYVSAPPEVKEGRKPTERQLLLQEKFKRNILFARMAIKDPELKTQYENAAHRGQSAFNRAFQDSAAAPQVLNVITSGYIGSIGNTIVVTADDDFKVNAVKVQILDAAGGLIEEGSASRNDDEFSWSYVTTKANPQLTGCKVKATAFDIPENEGTLEVTL